MTALHRVLALIAATLGVAAAFSDAGTRYMSAPALAESIMRGDPTLRLFDLRSRAEYDELHIPTATFATLEEVSSMPFTGSETVVLYGLRTLDVRGKQGPQLRFKGVRRVFILREGIYEWIARVRDPRLAVDATSAERSEFERAALFSRFFGGVARANVPRAEVPTGYWTSDQVLPYATAISESGVREALLHVRRRGC
jgi:rhodanese-related sulfurtransferase